MNCTKCGRHYVKNLARLESFLKDGIKQPDSRCTKEELKQWIDDACELMDDLRTTLIKSIAGEMNVSNSNEN